MLYEVGDYVNRNGRHRHTHYIISNSEILGYTPQQRRIIAAIARYLGKSRPTVEDGPMKLVDGVDRADVQKAIVLLRLARALNLGRSRAVEKVRIGVRSAEVEANAGSAPAHGSGSGTLGDRKRLRLISGKSSGGNFPRPCRRAYAEFSASRTTATYRKLRRISTFATAPFFSSSEASQPESLMIAPRNWLRFGLCPTTMMASWRAYFSSSLRKSANPASGRRPASICSLPS